MTPRYSIVFLLPLLLLIATATANDPPLASSGFRRGSETPQDDLVVSAGAPGQGREASTQGVLQQVAQGVFPASLWAVMPGWPLAPQVPPDTTDIYTHQQVSSSPGPNKAAATRPVVKATASSS